TGVGTHARARHAGNGRERPRNFHRGYESISGSKGERAVLAGEGSVRMFGERAHFHPGFVFATFFLRPKPSTSLLIARSCSKILSFSVKLNLASALRLSLVKWIVPVEVVSQESPCDHC